ncbi:SAM protein [Geosmithia morbida]|uniref:SAM protein n=1 Tax=Geosmithia morbida TaxID=1094350 RepID=A0A9P4YQR6_9HYPO|nr:SAM protein [Geosmithia morbida]KAF4121035.1 SAM protein [Geosmithia morbida]
MATKMPSGTAGKPEIGEVLMVIHDFLARSSDELTLTKGDRVELIERDDEFGDGWFLGKHLSNGNTGLFPEVYTRSAPNVPPTATTPSTTAIPTPLAPLAESSQEKPDVAADGLSSTVTASPTIADGPVTFPLQAAKTEPNPDPVLTAEDPASTSLRSPSDAGTGQDSQVLNDTLNVINEHITNLRSPASNSGLRSQGADSGSEYSASLHHRVSYIQGEETDEEEDATHTREEVESWTADDVAEFLFTSGVEKQHCEVFRDQEISGEVLLTMDQGSLFIKAFDLGSVGRRLKTWHKIKALQDEVSDDMPTSRPATQTYGSDIASEEGGARGRVRTSTMTTSPSTPHTSARTHRLSATYTPPIMAPLSSQGSPTQNDHRRRPSAASVRNLHHSRRHSSTDYQTSNPGTPRYSVNGGNSVTGATHKKQSSFDRNWTLGSAAPAQRLAEGNSEPDLQDSAVDMDRGYFSGTEVEGRSRNLLRKRDSATAESRKSSYAEEQRVRSATALSRHSRFGSVESYRDSSLPSPAQQKYYGAQAMPHRRTASTNTTESVRPIPPAKDTPPTVTRLDSQGSAKGPVPPAKDGDWLSSLVHKPIRTGGFGIRAISDNLGLDRNKHNNSIDSKNNSLPSPAATGSSTPSGGPSLELDSPTAGKIAMGPGAQPSSRNKGKKGKKETSAYTRGLLSISPQEAMKEADYSGWMRKKSSNLMTTWKPRFFVLRGRRLAYYYSEDDDAEKGLIDISYHRVLPADNEKLTGIHASITGAVGGHQPMPTSLTGGDDEELEKGDDSTFIFKLMPPKAGMSRGVHFTKPTVHYFAVSNLKQGRLWMAALMKATIDRDDSQPVTTTYQQKTISLAKAKQMRHRPPALMNLEEAAIEDDSSSLDQPRGPDGLGLFNGMDAASTAAASSIGTGKPDDKTEES